MLNCWIQAHTSALSVSLSTLQDRGVSMALNGTSFCADDDKMILEDEGARMALAGPALPVQDLVTGGMLLLFCCLECGVVASICVSRRFDATLDLHTTRAGIVVAVKGATDATGTFHVQQMCYPGLPDQVPRPVIEV